MPASINPSLTDEDIAFLRQQGLSDWQIANTSKSAAPQAASPNPISSTLKAHAGGILGGGGGSIAGGLLGAAAGSEVPIVGNVIGGIAGAIIGGLGGGAAGQGVQKAVESPDTYAAQQEAASQAAQAHPIESAATDILASGLASGGLPIGGVRGVGQVLARLAGKELGNEGKNVIANALINPAINTGIGLATGQGLPSGQDLLSQVVGGAAFGKSWLPHAWENESTAVTDKTGTGTELPAPVQPKLLGMGSEQFTHRPSPDNYIDVESKLISSEDVPEGTELHAPTIKGLLKEPELEHGDEVQATMPNGDKVNGHIVEHNPINGNPVVLQDNGQKVELPEESHTDMLNRLGQEISQKGISQPNEVRKEYPELNLTYNDARKVLTRAKRYANSKQSPVETIRSETPRPPAQVAAGKPSELQQVAGVSAGEEKGLPTSQSTNGSTKEEQEALKKELEESGQVTPKEQDQVAVSGHDWNKIVSPHRMGVKDAVDKNLGPNDVARLDILSKQWYEKGKEAAVKGDNEGFKQAFGEGTYYNGMKEGAAKEGPNYDRYMFEQTEKGNKEYTPAIRTEEGRLLTGNSHEEIKQNNPDVKGERGYVSKEGRFMTLLHVARENMVNKLEGLKSGVTGNGQLHVFGILPHVWDTAISLAQHAIKAGVSIAEAIDKAISHIKTSLTPEQKKTFSESQVRSAIEKQIEEKKEQPPKDRYLGQFGRAFCAVTDKVRDIGGATAEKLSGAFKAALNRKDELTGKWKNPVVQAGRKLNTLQRKRVAAAFNYELQHEKSGVHLLQSPAERNFYNIARAKLIESANHQQKIGEPIKVTKVLPNGKVMTINRSLIKDPYYYPGMPNRKVMDMYRKGSNTEGIAALDKEFDEWNKKVGLTDEQSKDRISNFKASLQGSAKAANMSHQDWFNARRKAQGTPLPPSFREADPVRNLERYFDRAATDASHYEYLERDHSILGALGQTHDAWGNKVSDEARATSIANHPEVQAALHQWTSSPRHVAEEVEEKLSSLMSAMFISGPPLEAHKIISNVVGTLASAPNPIVMAKALGHAITNINKGYQHAVEGNVMKMTAVSARRMFDGSASAAEKIQAVARGIRQVATLGDLTTKFNAALLQGMNEVIIPSKIERANAGDITQQKFLKNLDPSYVKGKEYTPEEAQGLASLASNYIHGTGDIRNLPAWMLNDSEFSGFFSLAHWSIARTNAFMRDVYEPATRGDMKPLLVGVFGAAVGGYLIKELRQDISGKKNPIPSLSEISSSSKGIEGNVPLVAYNLIAAMQYSGFGGLLSQIVKYPFDAAYKNNPQGATFPLDEIVSDVGGTIHKVQEAIANDTHINWVDLASAVSNHILTQDFQLSRIAINQGIDSGLITGMPAEKKGLSDKLAQLRRFDMVENLPYNDIDESSNPYSNLEQKQFKLSQNPQEAVQMLPGLINDIIQKYHDNPDVMKQKLKGLKENSYETFPAPETLPISFAKYVNYLNKEEGSTAAQAAIQDYFRHKVINQAKGSLIP